eukprot:746285-Hanusia_phi.AAC.3
MTESEQAGREEERRVSRNRRRRGGRRRGGKRRKKGDEERSTRRGRHEHEQEHEAGWLREHVRSTASRCTRLLSTLWRASCSDLTDPAPA